MKITAHEIRALEAAVGQFLDMIEAGSMDDRHQKYHAALKRLLTKAKAHKLKANINS